MFKSTRTKFIKTKGRSTHPYGDPTYLSFFFMFDWTGPLSPLFNGEAEAFLKDVLGDEQRALRLAKFKKYLQRINRDMPWFFQTLEGLDTAHTAGKLEDPYGPIGEISVECLETVDFTMGGIFDLYRSVILDKDRWCEVLPENLRKFNVFIHVQEIRNIIPMIGSESNLEKAEGLVNGLKHMKSLDGAGRKAMLDELGTDMLGKGMDMIKDRLNADQLDWKLKGMGPRFITRLTNCEFDWDNGVKMFSEITNNTIETQVKHTMKFNFIGSKMTNVEYLTAFNHSDPDPFSPFDGDLMGELKKAGTAAVKDAANQALTSGKAMIGRKLEDFKNKLLLGNVYEGNFLSNMQDVVNSGSINAITPMLKKEDPREPVNVGRPVGENVWLGYESPPETDLESTKIFEETLPETPLQGTNIFPPRSSDQDADTLGNALNDG